MRSDHIDQLDRHVDVRLFHRPRLHHAEIAGARRARDRRTGFGGLRPLVVAERLQAVRVVEVGQHQLPHVARFAVRITPLHDAVGRDAHAGKLARGVTILNQLVGAEGNAVLRGACKIQVEDQRIGGARAHGEGLRQRGADRRGLQDAGIAERQLGRPVHRGRVAIKRRVELPDGRQRGLDVVERQRVRVAQRVVHRLRRRGGIAIDIADAEVIHVATGDGCRNAEQSGKARVDAILCQGHLRGSPHAGDGGLARGDGQDAPRIGADIHSAQTGKRRVDVGLQLQREIVGSGIGTGGQRDGDRRCHAIDGDVENIPTGQRGCGAARGKTIRRERRHRSTEEIGISGIGAGRRQSHEGTVAQAARGADAAGSDDQLVQVVQADGHRRRRCAGRDQRRIRGAFDFGREETRRIVGTGVDRHRHRDAIDVHVELVIYPGQHRHGRRHRIDRAGDRTMRHRYGRGRARIEVHLDLAQRGRHRRDCIVVDLQRHDVARHDHTRRQIGGVARQLQPLVVDDEAFLVEQELAVARIGDGAVVVHAEHAAAVDRDVQRIVGRRQVALGELLGNAGNLRADTDTRGPATLHRGGKGVGKLDRGHLETHRAGIGNVVADRVERGGSRVKSAECLLKAHDRLLLNLLSFNSKFCAGLKKRAQRAAQMICLISDSVTVPRLPTVSVTP